MGKPQADAKPKKPAEPPPGERKAGPELEQAHKASNAAAMNDAIKNAFEEWQTLHTQAGKIREDMAEVVSKLKERFDLSKTAIRRAFADQLAEGGAKATYRSDYAAVCAALGDDFLELPLGKAAANGAAARDVKKGGEPVSAFAQGHEAFGKGVKFDACPYMGPGQEVNRDAWENGWHKGRTEWEREALPANKPAAPVEGSPAH